MEITQQLFDNWCQKQSICYISLILHTGVKCTSSIKVTSFFLVKFCKNLLNLVSCLSLTVIRKAFLQIVFFFTESLEVCFGPYKHYPLMFYASPAICKYMSVCPCVPTYVGMRANTLEGVSSFSAVHGV